MQQLYELLNGKNETRLSREQCKIFEKFLSELSYNTVVTVERTASKLALDYSLIERVLDCLVGIGEMEKKTGVRCPECGLLFASITSLESMEREMNCYGCKKKVEVYATDIEIIFQLSRNKS
jgi:hypothetical protein